MVQSHHLPRRALTGGFGAASGLGRIGVPASGETRLKVAGLFAGRVDDAGFMGAGYRGPVATREHPGAGISHPDGVPPRFPTPA